MTRMARSSEQGFCVPAPLPDCVLDAISHALVSVARFRPRSADAEENQKGLAEIHQGVAEFGHAGISDSV